MPPGRPLRGGGTWPRRAMQWLLSGVALLYKVKFLLLFVSVLASLFVYGWAFGWPFALGFVLLLGVHELGHTVAIRRCGLRASLPVFIPLLGAVIGLRQHPRNAAEEAYVGIAGPLFGLAATLVYWALAVAWHAPLLAVLAETGFFLHVFNLLPVAPLDGGRTVAFLRAKAWLPGFAALMVAMFYNPFDHRFAFDPVALIIVALVGSQLVRRLRQPAAAAYDAIGPRARWGYGALWLGLLGLSVFGMLHVSLAA